MSELKHRDLAYVRERAYPYWDPQLAQWWNPDPDNEDIEGYWRFFGTDWTARADKIEVVRRVKVVEQ